MGSDLQTVEITKWIELDKALDRLYKNEDFKKVILEEYFENKPLGAVSCLSEASFIERNQRGVLMEELVAVSNLQYFFKMIRNFAASARVAEENGELENA